MTYIRASHTASRAAGPEWKDLEEMSLEELELGLNEAAERIDLLKERL
jgi:hypothetical protein